VSVETPPPAEPATEKRCPRCGAGMTGRQEWCLSCGTAVGTRVAAAPGWRAPFAIAGVILALAAIAVAIAIVQLADDTGQVTQNAAATPPPATPAPAPTITPESTTIAPEATPEVTPEPTPASGAKADAKWPAGESGWTVVLASDSSESDAHDKADKFASDGIAGVGVLDSDDFTSLKPGFFVVFAGRYDSQAEAADALDGIDAKDAYIRRVEPA
jgi:septal ring-binding cell division protein DamX